MKEPKDIEAKEKKFTPQMVIYISIYVVTLLLILNLISRLDKDENISDVNEKVKYGISH